MNAGPTSTRIYDSLRTWILDRGFRPGSRLNPTLLADALSSSVTPVRDALHLLAGEELVTAAASGSFAMPLIDEPGLIDLYLWNGQVLELALRDQTRGSGQQLHPHQPIAGDTIKILIRRRITAHHAPPDAHADARRRVPDACRPP